MATNTNTSTFAMNLSKINVKQFIATALLKFSESLGDMVVTVLITGLALMWMATHVHPWLVETIGGYYITAMLIQLLIRVVHRFDDSWTTDEIGERVIELDAKLDERLDTLIRNS